MLDTYKEKMLKYIISLMSDKLRQPVSNYLYAYSDICEIRIREGLPIAFTLSGGNLITGISAAHSDIQYIIDRMTDGNYLKNEEIMRQGYLSLGYGVRVGVCGDVFVSAGEVKVLKYVKYLNIRLPTTYLTDCSPIIQHIENNSFYSSILLFSPPCQGKTTVLRSISYKLSSPPHQKRLCIVDTNRELGILDAALPCFCENLSGYPKACGINIAFKYMNPEYIICDEIGGIDEAREILASQYSGVPFIASAHADSFSSLLRRPNISLLVDNGVFDTLVKLTRKGNKIEYDIRKVSEL